MCLQITVQSLRSFLRPLRIGDVTCVCVCMYMCMYVCMYDADESVLLACMHTYMYTCMYVCMYVTDESMRQQQ